MTIAAEPLELTDSIENSVRRMSEPSKLQITDIRVPDPQDRHEPGHLRPRRGA